MSEAARAATAAPVPADLLAKRLRRCGWVGVIGLLAGLPLVFAMAFGGRFDVLALGAIVGWAIVAWLTRRCFATARAIAKGEPELRLGRLKSLSIIALIFPGLPILALAPWALMAGIGRLARNADPRELVFAAWGVLGLLYFVVLVLILLTVRRLRRRDSSF